MTTLRSTFDGICTSCKGAIRTGDKLEWTGSMETITHFLCSEAGAETQASIEASHAHDAQIEIPCPPDLAYLGYQKAGVAYALKNAEQGRGTIFGDEMGLGKTVEVIAFLNARPDLSLVLIVTRASMIVNWRREIRRWLVTNPNRVITVSSYESIPNTWTGWDLLVLDEVHNIKNPKAQRTKRVFELRKRSKLVIGLTGTPIPNQISELFTLLQLIDPTSWDPAGTVYKKIDGKPRRVRVEAGQGAGFWPFAKAYCGAKKEWHGHWSFNGATNLDDLQERLRATCMVRRLKADVLTELPPKRRETIVLGSAYTDAAQYLDALDDAEGAYERAWERVKRIPFDELAKARLEQGVAKVPLAVEHIEEVLRWESKLVVFAHHVAVLDALEAKLGGVLGCGLARIDGNVPPGAARQRQIDAFQSDASVSVFLGSLGAASEGITLTAASHVVFVERDWVPKTILQAEDRVHRIGQKDSVMVQHLVWEGSLDARMTELLVRKMEVADAALDRKD